MDINSEDKKYLVNHLLEWGDKHFESFPWRFTLNRWYALVAEVMLQRTRAEQVVPAYESFVASYSDPTDYIRDKEAKVFGTLGLAWREENLRKLAAILTCEDVPEEKEKLLALPGVGDYIAAAMRSLHMDIFDTIIDSNVVRLYGRYFGFATDPETRRKKWFIELAKSLTPSEQFKAYNYALIDFTRAICKPVPECPSCPLKEKCIDGQKSLFSNNM